MPLLYNVDPFNNLESKLVSYFPRQFSKVHLPGYLYNYLVLHHFKLPFLDYAQPGKTSSHLPLQYLIYIMTSAHMIMQQKQVCGFCKKKRICRIHEIIGKKPVQCLSGVASTLLHTILFVSFLVTCICFPFCSARKFAVPDNTTSSMQVWLTQGYGVGSSYWWREGLCSFEIQPCT